ncbi:MAG: chitobiase/beta-hexosaminidase C-terminal domain-containing protein, partial [Bacillota bacterium]
MGPSYLRTGAVIERLESRRLLSANPLISEFMAINTSGLVDRDGDHSDWIEIHNPDTASLNLDGYYLTNDAHDLTRWRFPVTNLPADGYLVVFASEKNRAAAGQELHTNFKLDGDGQYLALVAPDGHSILSQYGPQFPAQLPNVSYGMGTHVDSTPLVGPVAAGTVLIPKDDSLGLGWTTVGYDDQGWTAGTTGVGFQPPRGVVNDDDMRPVNDAAANFLPCTSDLYQMSISGQIDCNSDDWFCLGTLDAGDVITIVGPSLSASANGIEVWRGSPGNRALECSAKPMVDSIIYEHAVTTTDTYYVRMLKPNGYTYGAYTLRLWLEDHGTPPSTDNSVGRETEPNDSIEQANDVSGAWNRVQFQSQWVGKLTLYDTDDYRLRLTAGDTLSVHVQAGSGLAAYVSLLGPAGELVASGGNFLDTSASTLPPGDAVLFSQVIRSTGTYCVRVQQQSSTQQTSGTYTADVYLSTNTQPPLSNPYSQLIGTDVQSSMRNATSAYLRVPFGVGSQRIDRLKLRMKYDDGFVAYINGQEVARRNAPTGQPHWNSAATAAHPNDQAMIAEEFEIPTGVLVQGENVLAIQGLNSRGDAGDFLIDPELEGLTLTPDLEQYFTAPTPGAANSLSSVWGFVADTKFSHDRGFYEAPFSVTITTTTPDAQLRYTTDGSEPTPTNGLLYTGPIPIATTTVLRAMAFKAGFISSNVDTQTYLFLNNVIQQPASPGGFPKVNSGINWDYEMDPNVVNNPAYRSEIIDDLKSIPSLSLVADTDELFGLEGIYQNAGKSGPAWERAASVEWINPDGSQGFQIDAGLRMYGAAGRSDRYPKHSFRLLFKDQYGAGKLKYPVFENALFGNSAVDEFDTLVLRGGFNNTWTYGKVSDDLKHAQYLQDAFAAATQLAMGEPAPHQQFVHLYINGLYWGLYAVAERPSAPFAASYVGGKKEDYDA